jgi:hypothetical protein
MPDILPMAPKDTTTFYLLPLVASESLNAISLWKNSDEEKMSGKQARKIGRISRALQAALTESNQQREDVVTSYRDRYPEGHEKAGEFVPVYKKDADGNDTEEVDPTKVRLRPDDIEAFNKDIMELFSEPLIVVCPALLASEIDSIRSLPGNMIEALFSLEEGAETTIAPEKENVVNTVVETEVVGSIGDIPMQDAVTS